MSQILIIDDHPRFLKTLSFALEDDYGILLAGGGEEGVAKMERERPDLVLLDYFMPDLDGMEVLARMRLWPDRPRVILMSARMNEEICQKARELGAIDCIEKPFNLPDLLGKIARVLRR